MSNNLTSGYHRDYQIFKGRIIDAILDAIECIKVFNYSINKIKVRKNILDDDKYKFIFSVENLNELVKNGKTFRDSYNQISKEIKNNAFKPNKTIKHTLIGGIHNLSLDQIELKMKENFKLWHEENNSNDRSEAKETNVKDGKTDELSDEGKKLVQEEIKKHLEKMHAKMEAVKEEAHKKVQAAESQVGRMETEYKQEVSKVRDGSGFVNSDKLKSQ